MSAVNPNVTNVRAAFSAVAQTGKLHTFNGAPPVDLTPTFPHVQGIARYGNHLLLTHSVVNIFQPGKILVLSQQSNDLVYAFDTPRADFNHPGGIQAIGEFLVVPVENDDHSRSYICFYDLSEMSDTVPPTLLSTRIPRPSGGAGAAGITNFTVDGAENYLLAAYDNGATDFYQSTVLFPTPNFGSVLFSHKLHQTDYSSICLVTGTNQEIYLIGFRTEDLGGGNEDYVDLHQVDLANQTVSGMLQTRHMITQYGSMKGPAGVHFRWGAGLMIVPGQTGADASLKFFATQRNFVANLFATNSF